MAKIDIELGNPESIKSLMKQAFILRKEIGLTKLTTKEYQKYVDILCELKQQMKNALEGKK